MLKLALLIAAVSLGPVNPTHPNGGDSKGNVERHAQPHAARLIYQPACDSPPYREDAAYCQEAKEASATRDQATAAIVGDVIAFLGFGAVIVALVFNKQAINHAARSADAAAIAAKAAMAANRPKIRVKHLWLTNDITAGKPITVDLGIVNTETTEATLSQYGIRFVVIDADGQIPFDPFFEPINIGGQKSTSGVWGVMKGVGDGTILTIEQITAIQEHRSRLYALGFVSYVDPANRVRITGFCRVLTFRPDTLADVKNGRFRTFPDPDYEYQD